MMHTEPPDHLNRMVAETEKDRMASPDPFLHVNQRFARAVAPRRARTRRLVRACSHAFARTCTLLTDVIDRPRLRGQ